MIDRKGDLQHVKTALKRNRVVALLGPRQCGKTTLARQFAAADSLNYLDPSMRQALADLKLHELKVVYPGTTRYSLAKRVEVLPLSEVV